MTGSRFVIAFLALPFFTACASTPDPDREPAADGRKTIRQAGESCRLNLDGDKDLDLVEITTLGDRRAVVIRHADAPKPFIEELASMQYVECVSNQEPGVPVRGTDDTEKAVSIPLLNDYLRVEKREASARLMYFDRVSNSYRAIWQAD